MLRAAIGLGAVLLGLAGIYIALVVGDWLSIEASRAGILIYVAWVFALCFALGTVAAQDQHVATQVIGRGTQVAAVLGIGGALLLITDLSNSRLVAEWVAYAVVVAVVASALSWLLSGILERESLPLRAATGATAVALASALVAGVLTVALGATLVDDAERVLNGELSISELRGVESDARTLMRILGGGLVLALFGGLACALLRRGHRASSAEPADVTRVRAGTASDEAFDSLARAVIESRELVEAGRVRGIIDSALLEAGVREIDVVGERFDPTRHKAVMSEVPPPGSELDGVVARSVTPGYEVDDRLLRIAEVSVYMSAST